MKNIVIIGSSGAIAKAFINKFISLEEVERVNIFGRSLFETDSPKVKQSIISVENEDSIKQASLIASEFGPIDVVIVATGALHNDQFSPEKSLKELSLERFEYFFKVNTIFPALIAKYFAGYMNKNTPSKMAFLSAKVGSISDNYLGGWYSYRASKAALNMLIKNISIEISRSNKNAVIVGLHPGTVDSNLSKPFQSHVKDGSLFTPAQSVSYMLDVVEKLSVEQTGKIFSYDGKEILP